MSLLNFFLSSFTSPTKPAEKKPAGTSEQVAVPEATPVPSTSKGASKRPFDFNTIRDKIIDIDALPDVAFAVPAAPKRSLDDIPPRIPPAKRRKIEAERSLRMPNPMNQTGMHPTRTYKGPPAGQIQPGPANRNARPQPQPRTGAQPRPRPLTRQPTGVVGQPGPSSIPAHPSRSPASVAGQRPPLAAAAGPSTGKAGQVPRNADRPIPVFREPSSPAGRPRAHSMTPATSRSPIPSPKTLSSFPVPTLLRVPPLGMQLVGGGSKSSKPGKSQPPRAPQTAPKPPTAGPSSGAPRSRSPQTPVQPDSPRPSASGSAPQSAVRPSNPEPTVGKPTRRRKKDRRIIDNPKLKPPTAYRQVTQKELEMLQALDPARQILIGKPKPQAPPPPPPPKAPPGMKLIERVRPFYDADTLYNDFFVQEEDQLSDESEIELLDLDNTPFVFPPLVFDEHSPDWLEQMLVVARKERDDLKANLMRLNKNTDVALRNVTLAKREMQYERERMQDLLVTIGNLGGKLFLEGLNGAVLRGAGITKRESDVEFFVEDPEEEKKRAQKPAPSRRPPHGHGGPPGGGPSGRGAPPRGGAPSGRPPSQGGSSRAQSSSAGPAPPPAPQANRGARDGPSRHPAPSNKRARVDPPSEDESCDADDERSVKRPRGNRDALVARASSPPSLSPQSLADPQSAQASVQPPSLMQMLQAAAPATQDKTEESAPSTPKIDKGKRRADWKEREEAQARMSSAAPAESSNSNETNRTTPPQTLPPAVLLSTLRPGTPAAIPTQPRTPPVTPAPAVPPRITPRPRPNPFGSLGIELPEASMALLRGGFFPPTGQKPRENITPLRNLDRWVIPTPRFRDESDDDEEGKKTDINEKLFADIDEEIVVYDDNADEVVPTDENSNPIPSTDVTTSTNNGENTDTSGASPLAAVVNDENAGARPPAPGRARDPLAPRRVLAPIPQRRHRRSPSPSPAPPARAPAPLALAPGRVTRATTALARAPTALAPAPTLAPAALAAAPSAPVAPAAPRRTAGPLQREETVVVRRRGEPPMTLEEVAQARAARSARAAEQPRTPQRAAGPVQRLERTSTQVSTFGSSAGPPLGFHARTRAQNAATTSASASGADDAEADATFTQDSPKVRWRDEEIYSSPPTS